MCTRCGKRIAVVFVTRVEGDKTINEGLCLVCAKELGIKPVNDIISKMGISEEDLEAMAEEVSSLIPSDDDDDDNEGRAPAINFNSLFPGMRPKDGADSQGKAQGEKSDKKKEEKKMGKFGNIPGLF